MTCRTTFQSQELCSTPLIRFRSGKSRKVVFRGGQDLLRDYRPSGDADMLRFNGQTLQQIVLSNPSYPNPFTAGGVAQTLPNSIVRFAPDLRLHTTCSTALVWKRSYKNRRHSRPPTWDARIRFVSVARPQCSASSSLHSAP